MTFDDQRVDTSGVDDRRGRSRAGGLAVGGGGLGLVGLLLVLLVNALTDGAVDPTQFTTDQVQTQRPAESTTQLQERCNTSGAIDAYNDCYLIKSYNEVNEVWTAELQRRGLQYRQPRLVFFEQATSTGCGTASAQI